MCPRPPVTRSPTGRSPGFSLGRRRRGWRGGLAGRIEAEGFELLWVPHEGMIGGAIGLTNFETRQVAVRENMPDAAQVKTEGHELAHVLMHGPDQEDARRHRGIGEVEAESVALMIGAAHGMDTSEYTIPYVAGWAAAVDGKNPVEVVQAAGERIRKTAIDILDKLDTIQVPDGTPPGLDRDTPRRLPERGPGPAAPAVEPEEARPERVGRGL